MNAQDELEPVAARSDSPTDHGRWRRAWPYLLVVVVALSASVLHVARYTQMSPNDESRHVDYMAQLFEHGHVVKLGDKIGETAMRLETCRGIDLGGYTPPPCSAQHLHPRDFRDNGYNNAVNNPPTYYVITGAIATAAKSLGLSRDILDPARIMSGVWLALGLALAVYAGELLGLRRAPLAAAGTIFAVAAQPLYLGSTVNADSASVFAGALVLVVALLWERRRIQVAWLLAAGALVASLKMTNLIGVGIVTAWLLTRAYGVWRRSSSPGPGAEPDGPDGDPPIRTARDFGWAAGLLVAGAVGVTILWLGIAGARATIDALALPSNAKFYEPGFPFRTLVLRQNVFSLFPPVDGYRPPVLGTSMNETVGYASVLLAAAVMVVALLRFRVADRCGTLVAWAGVVLVAAGPGFIVSTWFVNRVIFAPVARYGLSAIAVIIVGVAAAVRGRVGTWVLSAYAVVAVATVLGTLAFA